MRLSLILNEINKEITAEEPITLQFIDFCVRQEFKSVGRYNLYFIDDQDDKIIIQTNAILNSNFSCQPQKGVRIFINPLPSFVMSNISEIRNLTQEPIYQSKVEQNVVVVKEGRNVIEKIKIHNVACTVCGMKPIIGVRYLCAVCPQYNLCSICQQIYDHLHPFIKIKYNYQVPSKCIMEFNQNINQTALSSLKFHRKSSQQLIYESQQQKRHMIASYLQDLMGGQAQFSEQFAQVSLAQKYDMIFDEYMSWLQNKNKKGSNIFVKWWRMFKNNEQKDVK